MSNTQAPDVRGLNLEGAPCITRCPAVLLVSSRGAAGSPAPASTLQLKIAVAWSPKTASAGRALTFTARDSARHLSIEQQRLPREEGDGDDLYHFQVRRWTVEACQAVARTPLSNSSNIQSASTMVVQQGSGANPAVWSALG